MGLEQDVNKAVVIAGNMGRYQYILMTILCLIFYFDAFLLLGPSFYLMDPTFICDGSDDIVDQYQACPKIAECHIVNDFTITKYMGLYCQRQGQRDMIQALLSLGSLIGLLVMNFVADLRGRRLALIIDLIIAVLSSFLTLIGTYAQTSGLLVFASILAGFSGYSVIVVSYILAGDVCQQQMRQKSSLYMNCSYSAGLITFFFMYNWINQWYNILVLFILLPYLGLTIIAIFMVQQSPNYYLCKIKNKKKCIDTLTNIALHNGKTDEQVGEIQTLISNSQQSVQQKQKENSKASVLSVLKQWRFLKIIVFMAIVQSGANIFFYGIQYAIDDIGYNFGIDNLVLGCTEITITLILSRFISKLKRKKTLLIGYLTTVALSMLFLIKAINSSPLLSTLLIVGIRSATSFGYFMIVMIQTQSFPLEIQSIGAGSIQAFAQMGSIAAPLLITFAVDNGLQKMATMGVVLLVCLIPTKFVPEPNVNGQIKKSQLQQTLLESQLEGDTAKAN